ncbi:50S ribosomal protein L11 methyltransferase, partial [bacterium]|nr:50S ribosomal protein L11 methyltransferase [bacterium]
MELSLEIEREHAEAVETALQSLGASAVTLLDNANQDLLEPGVGETPLWASMRILSVLHISEP